jgi:hypothetical protein
MSVLAGVGLFFLGVTVFFYGDRKLKFNEGKLLRFLSQATRWHKVSIKVQKWIVGLVLMWFGLGLIIGM